MKKTLLTLSLVVVAAAAFAQGKVSLANDTLSPITLAAAGGCYAADTALAGMAVPTTGALPSGKILTVGLYGGTTAGSLTLQGKVDLNPAGGTGYDAGTLTPTKIVLTGIPGGATAFFQVKVWENTFANYDAATSGYLGVGNPFTMTPGASIAYPNTYNGGATTWSATPIVVTVPEPSTMALAGLGAAALLIFRRRK